ncbi:MAG: inorganic phosphate transporter [Gemmatimonadota bacterium]
MIWLFLLSGLFLGWSLGANDAANIFGTAVGTRMVKFRVAAVIASGAVIVGAVVGGSGTTATLGALGAVDAPAGAFTVALAAGLAVTWMSRAGLPVSTSQAIVGAIVGWNLFAGAPTDFALLAQIVSTWVVSPILAAALAAVLYLLVHRALRHSRIHMLELDAYTRLGLILVGAFGAYSLGANNIGNVMGVFASAAPFAPIPVAGGFELSGVQQLFLLGGVAISVGIFTNSFKVMSTVGSQIFKLTPILALVVVLAHSLVLFLFASTGLRGLLVGLGLPALPLVPVSSTQAIVGAILGVALVRGSGAAIRYGLLGRVAIGWIVTPVAAGLLSFVALFFVQNVFQLEVVGPAR